MDAERIQLQESISISVQPQYLPDQSNEDAQEFTFAYTVDITNQWGFGSKTPRKTLDYY